MKAFTILRNAPAEDPSNTDNQNINGIKTEGTMIRNGDSIAAKLTCQSVKTSKVSQFYEGLDSSHHVYSSVLGPSMVPDTNIRQRARI